MVVPWAAVADGPPQLLRFGTDRGLAHESHRTITPQRLELHDRGDMPNYTARVAPVLNSRIWQLSRRRRYMARLHHCGPPRAPAAPTVPVPSQESACRHPQTAASRRV
jgi:hypothetical protein